MTRRRFSLLSGATFPTLGLAAAGNRAPDFDAIRQKHGVPALGGGIVTMDGLQFQTVTGARKAGGTTAATTADLWHLGSMTKAMTATLLGTFVAQAKLKWDATLGDLLPDLMTKATLEAQRITVRQLLTHRSGLPANREHWDALPAAADRAAIVREECARPLTSAPGTAFLYSNLGYMTAGVVAERLGGHPWESLMQTRLFSPLKMSAGFGGTGTAGKEDQPWPHDKDGQPMPANGPATDNPPSLGPAGTCHTTLADYARFAADHLRGAAGKKALLPASLYTDLHTPAQGEDYAMGWTATTRDWAGGKVLTHNGTNNMNYFVAWLAPLKGFAVIAACNQGGDPAAKACDAVCAALISMHLK